ncbi:thiopurine S-methyltransferase [Gammaproteobacteria bacterium AB-CW1]|uniref:Thiopurine S-methyltransferase n=1 Tax=Natronospira elongata TaxID=3110268 RepID=A0AAP6MLR8_9GAMM|nr:thiopurine S-methyltransferase [Gammaproteobacteria bacterium AB-CW1]MEA5446280.1 thiopurine S-methyltransferase [Gammaproteobacteria bacterium AB-CW1]
MDPEFWRERWHSEQIGFHEGHVNAHLRQFWQHLDARPGEKVLVPLCGKAHDLAWLRDQGCYVIGVELSDLACAAFFAERGIEPAESSGQRFTCYRHRDIELWCGDFFDLTADDIGLVELVYDRAALIALPPAMRQRYVDHLQAITGPATRSLLITLDYPEQPGFQGPPFNVSDQEVEQLYSANHDIERIHHSRLREDDGLRKRGLEGGTESVFHLRRR